MKQFLFTDTSKNSIFRNILKVFLITASMLCAAEDKGIPVQVVMNSGVVQKAQFLGITQDTVNLGGYIKDQFTILRIAKNQFKSIVDAEGHDLLNGKPAKIAMAEPATITNNISATDTSQKTNSTDSTQVAPPPSDPSIFPADAKVFMGFEAIGINSDKVNAIESMTFMTLKEKNEKFVQGNKSQFPDCADKSCIQNEIFKMGIKEIFFGNISNSNYKDSMKLQLTRVVLEDSLPSIYKSEVNISAHTTIEDAISNNKMKQFVLEAQGFPKEVQKKTKSYIHVETDPEGATISYSTKDALCKSPCTFATLDTTKISLNAYWKVEHLWGAQTTVLPIPGDTVKVSLRLKRISPEVRVLTKPSNAEIFAGTSPITKKSAPLIRTPDKFTMTEPGMINIQIRHEGYKDSLVSFYLPPVPETTLSIDLEELKDYKEIEAQANWFKNRKIYHLGQTLMGTSLAPVIVGAIFVYLARQDYNDADHIKEELKMPGDPNGKNFNKKIEKNHDLVHSGNVKSVTGGSLIGTGLILFGIGLYLTF